ncbi:MAG: glycosyltransferase, partial [Deltaproteobacteria bacterium]|nr:glycosyltransferase [Deltaproteobacteria bacterium]
MTVLLWLWALGGLAGRLLAVAKLRVLFSPRWRLDPAPAGEGAGRTRLSVCVPARDEAAVIDRLLASLDAQDLDGIEVIVVDDRSTDGTGDIARRHRCRVIEGTEPPESWLGKNWALQQAVDAATGEVLLFVDADTWHAPGACRSVLATMERLDVDVLVVLGGQRVEGWAERLVQPFFWSLLLSLFDPSRAKDPRYPDDAMGNGQFAAFRREAYLRAGGHEAVRDRIVEDVALVREVKRRGGRYAVRVGPAITATHMYRGLDQLWRGFKKNAAVVDPDRKGLSVALTAAALVLVFQAELWPWTVLLFDLAVLAVGELPHLAGFNADDEVAISAGAWLSPGGWAAVKLMAAGQLAAIFAGRFLVYHHLCDARSYVVLSRHPLVYLLQPLGAVVGMAAM